MPDPKTTAALVALAGHAENYNEAVKSLKDQGIRDLSADDLRNLRRQHPKDYNRIRTEGGQALERFLIDDLRHRAARASQIELLALEKTEQRLRENRDTSPAKTAELLAKSKDINLSKALTLDGRPSEIKENRQPMEIIRSLVAAKILKELPEGE